jgi:hypothetical protein
MRLCPNSVAVGTTGKGFLSYPTLSRDNKTGTGTGTGKMEIQSFVQECKQAPISMVPCCLKRLFLLRQLQVANK